jgi:hypothetical protein
MSKTVYIIWNRDAMAAIPGTFPTSSEAAGHITRLLSKERDSKKPITRDVVAVTV